MKKILTTTIAICLTIIGLHAQDNKLNPGIYSVTDSTTTPLPYTNGVSVSNSNNLLGVEIGDVKYKYKGTSSGVEVKDMIVMVINPEKKVITKTMKKYDPFVKSMTPANIIIVPLDIEKGNRIYDEGKTIEGINTTRKNRVEFEWEMIDDNTYRISADFAPGEYAVVFKPAKLGGHDFTSIFGFYVSE